MTSLYGGFGNDTYVLDSTWPAVPFGAFQVYDYIEEYLDEGIDTVQVKPDVSDFGIEDTFFYTSYTLGLNIENGLVLGTDAFTLFGNVLNNGLTGNGAANSLYGFDGNNSLSGMAGSDVLFGAKGNDTLDGGADADSLYGGDNNDSLTGGFGVDRLEGGLGNDTYVLDSTAPLVLGGLSFVYDTVVEAADAGIDTIRIARAISSIGIDDTFFYTSYTLGQTIENGVVIGTEAFDLTGNTLGNQLTGNGAANYLRGLGGNDRLQGQGGDDTVEGGNGQDTLAGGEGADLLRGDDGNDNLSGDGGLDTLEGGDGNDVYILDNTAAFVPGGSAQVYDTVAELPGGGTDTIRIARAVADFGIDDTTWYTSYTLGTEIENGLVLGIDDFDLVGNAARNVLTGNVGANLLDGQGGNDVLNGGFGADTLLGGLGNDALNGGNEDDLLAGGDGLDTLTGGAGADRFRFDTTPRATTNRDVIADYSVADDTIELSLAIFTKLALGVLDPAAFGLGAVATDAAQRILYDDATGSLFYDADGSGAARAPVLFATVTPGLGLTADDIVVIA